MLSSFSKSDQEYVRSVQDLITEPVDRNARTFYLEDDAWPGYLKGGLIVLSVSGDVQTKAPPLEYVDEYDPKPPPKWKTPKKGDVLVVGHQIQTGNDGKMGLLLTKWYSYYYSFQHQLINKNFLSGTNSAQRQ